MLNINDLNEHGRLCSAMIEAWLKKENIDFDQALFALNKNHLFLNEIRQDHYSSQPQLNPNQYKGWLNELEINAEYLSKISAEKPRMTPKLSM